MVLSTVPERAGVDPPSRPASRTLPAESLQRIRSSRRHPRSTQPDYLHLRSLVDDLRVALDSIPHPVRDVLDVFCGARPYDDLLPAGSRCVGLDVDERYGAADIVSREFLPFEDASFDLVMSIEAFHYVEDPAHGAAEIGRVLRPGGTTLIAVPLVWEYNRTILEHRFTGPELEAVFTGWDDVRVVENGGIGVSWATLTGRLLKLRERRLSRPIRLAARPLFIAAYRTVNAIGALIERSEARRARDPHTLPMNLLLTARRPAA